MKNALKAAMQRAQQSLRVPLQDAQDQQDMRAIMARELKGCVEGLRIASAAASRLSMMIVIEQLREIEAELKQLLRDVAMDTGNTQTSGSHTRQ